MSFKHRSILDTIPGYKQGKPAPAKPGQRTFKLSSNENAFEPLPSVAEAITSQATGRMNRYPDMRGWAVVERLAERYGVEAGERHARLRIHRGHHHAGEPGGRSGRRDRLPVAQLRGRTR